jgi:small subunit ribosomal protein S13
MYLLGVNIPENKPIVIGLTNIYGIGFTRSKLICHKLGINPLSQPKDLINKQLSKLGKLINRYSIEMDLKKNIKNNIQKLINLGTYRGLRHKLGLPVRGQRTRSNARTQKYLSKKIKTKIISNNNRKIIKKKIKKNN